MRQSSIDGRMVLTILLVISVDPQWAGKYTTRVVYIVARVQHPTDFRA
jgi:hypothetical protein